MPFGSTHEARNCMTGPADKRGEKRGRALRARGEASMLTRLRASRLSAAPALKSDAELIAEAIAAGKVRRIPRGISGLPEFAPSDGHVEVVPSAGPVEPEM